MESEGRGHAFEGAGVVLLKLCRGGVAESRRECFCMV